MIDQWAIFIAPSDSLVMEIDMVYSPLSILSLATGACHGKAALANLTGRIEHCVTLTLKVSPPGYPRGSWKSMTHHAFELLLHIDPPPSQKNRFTPDMFLGEFPKVLEALASANWGCLSITIFAVRRKPFWFIYNVSFLKPDHSAIIAILLWKASLILA